jgi:hypothetical protein
VRLQASEEDVEVAKSDITIVDSSKLSENHPALKLMKDKYKSEKEKEKHSSHSSKGTFLISRCYSVFICLFRS